MIARDSTGAETWLLSLPPTPRQTRWATAVAVCQVAALALLAPFAKTRLMEINAFIPAFEGVIFVTDLVTSVLLFSQFAIHRLRALLVLACGYLFSTLIVIPHALTFPGAFFPTGLLGAGLQTTASLYWFWHLLFPLALLGYGLMRDEKSDPGPAQPSALAVIVLSVVLVLVLVCALTLLATAGNDYMPVLFADRVGLTPAARVAAATTMLASVSALTVLSLRRRSLLNQWLMIVALATILEMGLGAIFVSERFSLGFYAGRLFSLLTSTIVLVVLLAETTRLYVKIARSNEGKVRRLVDANIIGILIWDFEGRILEANEAFLNMVGYAHEDLVAGRIRWTDLTPPEWRDRDTQLIQEHKASGTLRPFEKEYFRKDGTRVPVLIGVATFEEGGNQGVAFVLDLTERKRAEEALRRSEAYLAEAQRLSQTGSFGWTPSTGEFHWSDETFRILKYDSSVKPTMERLLRRVHPDDLVIVRQVIDETLRGDKVDIAHRLLMPDGSVKFLHVLGRALKDAAGNLETVGAVMDVTERKRAEEALQRSEANLAEAQRLSHTGSWALSPATTKILYWSEECYRIWGFDPAQGLPDRAIVWRRIYPEDRERVLVEADEALRQKRDHTIGFRIVLPDGEVKHLEAIGHHRFSTDGELVQVVGTNIDVTERKRAEEGLRDSEYKLRQIIETVPSLIWSTNPDGEPTQLNQRIFDYSGMRLVDFKHGGWEVFIHPDDFPKTIRAFSHAIQTGTSYETVHRLRRADGEFRWHHARGEPLRDEEGRIIQWYGLALDIDEAKKAEDRLRRSEAYLAEAQRLSHAGSWAYDPAARRFLYWSEENYRIWGFDPAHGTPDREVANGHIHPDDRDRVRDEAMEARRQKRDYTTEFRIVLPDGTVKYVEGIVHHVFSAEGELIELTGTNVDVTERKKAQDQLRRGESYLAEAQRLGHTGTCVFDATTMLYLYWSNACYRIWGLDPVQGLPSRETVWQRIHPDDRGRVWEGVEEALREKKGYEGEFKIVLTEGTVKYLASSMQHLCSADGEIVEVIDTHIDVTERKRAQEEHERLRQLESELAHMNRLGIMGEQAASLVHEITQPIAAARNNARAAMNFLDQGPPERGEIREALGCVVADADRAGEIIDRVRDHIKKAPPRKHRFDLNHAIDEVVLLGQSAIAENGVSVQTHLSDGSLPVEGDRVQLQQVLLNLVLNAVEAMSAIEAGPRELLVSTEQTKAKGFLVAVRDSGPGIDPEHLERVFEAFYTTKPSGVGMGLAICRTIIEAHGGRLWAEANEPRGAAFRFTLPSGEF